MSDRRSPVAGIAFDALTLSGAVDRIIGLASGAQMATVVTPNVDHIVLFHRDAAFRSAIEHANLVVADGQPIVWAARLDATPLPERVTGSDLLPAVAEAAARHGLRVFLCGAEPGVAEAAAARLCEQSPALIIAGTLAPERADLDAPSTIAAINAARPDLLFVAFGAPVQEIWLERHRSELEARVGIGVGAGIDFAAGVRRRAPAWVQRHGLEWAYRLIQEPRRLWRRYLLRDPAFAWYVLADLRRRRRWRWG